MLGLGEIFDLLKIMFLPISVWKIGQQSIGVGVVVLVVKTLDRENCFSGFTAQFRHSQYHFLNFRKPRK